MIRRASRRRSVVAAALAIAAAALMLRTGAPLKAVALEVAVTPDESARRVDVSIGGKPFTSYIWPERLKKPVLYPLRAASGTLVTRGWPFDPRPGERVDHPHHVGLWFDYGDVNGIDFWNNSDALKADEQAKMGVIVHRKLVEARGGAAAGTLVTESEWLGPGSARLLRERAVFTFRGDDKTRVVDRVTTLTALERRVVFNDNKEGLLGMRVARQLEQPSTTPEVFTDASGRATSVPVLDNTGVTGLYTSSEGKTGDSVWSTRGAWTMLTGRIGSEALTIAILDHPANPGYPTYWHARGYGLFAANPLGQKIFTEGKQPALNLTLEPGDSTTFRYRVVILEGTATSDRIEHDFKGFAAERSLRPSR
jgi:methane monooxygenase PmoA-like